MSSRLRFLIYFPTNRNPNFLLTSLLHLHAFLHLDPDLKSRCQIVIVASPTFYAAIAKTVKIFQSAGYHIELWRGNEYLDKLKLVFRKYPVKKFPYFIKHDDDIFISVDSWAKLLRYSPKELENKKVLLTTLNLSSGIPSWSFFAKKFLQPRIYQHILGKIKLQKIPDQIWGNDYSALSKGHRQSKKWSEQAYWQKMNALGYHYRGLHPIRLSIQIAYDLNQYIVQHYHDFLNHRAGRSFKRVSNRYFCNNFFVIKYAKYQKLIRQKKLYVDPFDEVPVNRYLLRNKLFFSFLNGSVGVHIAYNTIYDQTIKKKAQVLNGRELELFFLEKYYLLITHYLKILQDSLNNQVAYYQEPFLRRFLYRLKKMSQNLIFPLFVEKLTLRSQQFWHYFKQIDTPNKKSYLPTNTWFPARHGKL